MGASLGASKGAIGEINMTPLIDIVLVVLIIMMVNIPIQIEQMGVKLPGKVTVQSQDNVPTEQLVIAVYPMATGDKTYPIALNRRLMNEESLFFEVTRRLRPMESKAVFIDAHPDVPYAEVVKAVDLARAAGAGKVGLAKMKESGPLPATSVAPGSQPKGVTFGNPTVIGSMTDLQADAAIQPLKGSLELCYEKSLPAKPDLSGRMLLRFTVGPQGEQMSQKIANDNLEDPTLTECVTALLPAVKFPVLGEQKTAIVQVPVLFSPG